MASFDLPEIPQPRVSPALLVGAASPLWSYFGAAAAGGLAYWWMTQWARPVNLEALIGAAKPAPAPLALPEPMVEAVETAADAVEEVIEALPEIVPVGGEAAPISPLLEAEPVLEAAFEAEPVLDIAAEPVIEEPAPIGAALAADLSPKPRAKKAPPVEPEA